MGSLAPIAFDIETSGLEPGAVITIAGLAFELGHVVIVNTGGRSVDTAALETRVTTRSSHQIDLRVCQSESALLTALGEASEEHIDTDGQYLTAYHGETWKGGFDLPFLRTSCAAHNADWPFPEMAYADMLDVINRFNTNDTNDLVGVYEQLVGDETCDPFTDSGEAVDAFHDGDWTALLLHNIADIQRTRELAVLAGRYVPKSDFRMKNLTPPNQ